MVVKQSRNEQFVDGGRLYEDLDAARRMRGLTWAGVSARVGCSRATLCLIRSRGCASASTLLRACHAFGLPACRYIRGCGHEHMDVRGREAVFHETLVLMGVPPARMGLVRELVDCLAVDGGDRS